jgi:hypothetical protein
MTKWLWLALLCACKRDFPQASSQAIALSPAKDGAVVASVGTQTITADELRARIDEANGAARERYRDPREVHALLDNEIRFELLVGEALRRGYDRDPQVQEAARKAMVQKLLAAQLGEASEVTESDVQAFYDRNISEYRQPERVQLAIVKAESAQTGASVRDKLQRGKQDPMAFAALRTELGQESNRDLELKYWSFDELKAAYGEELAKASFDTREIGALGPVTRTSHGYFVFKLTGRRNAFHRATSDVAESIRLPLFRQRRSESFDALVRKLREDTKVTIDEAALRQVYVER